MDYLLPHYEVACVIWNAFFSQFELSWVMPKQVVDLYAWWMTVSNTQECCCDDVFMPYVMSMAGNKL
jgi:hypothetical protein